MSNKLWGKPASFNSFYEVTAKFFLVHDVTKRQTKNRTPNCSIAVFHYHLSYGKTMEIYLPEDKKRMLFHLSST